MTEPELLVREAPRRSRLPGAALWAVAFIAMFLAAGYQRRTGPTYPIRGTLEGSERAWAYELPRSAETTGPARVALPMPGDFSGRVMVRRFPTQDEFVPIELRRETVDGRVELAGYLPPQPEAGKVEYWFDLSTPRGAVRVPEEGTVEGVGSTIVLRFKGPVPTEVLVAHILLMFVSMMVGVRAALEAIAGGPRVRSLSWWTLGGLTLGGMILGPVVQKHAFGDYWTGFPWGYDLTDNKTLLMWLAWIVACAVLLRRREEAPAGGPGGRAAVVAAAGVMLAVYLIPHSMYGSQYDYEQGEVTQATSAAPAAGVRALAPAEGP